MSHYFQISFSVLMFMGVAWTAYGVRRQLHDQSLLTFAGNHFTHAMHRAMIRQVTIKYIVALLLCCVFMWTGLYIIGSALFVIGFIEALMSLKLLSAMRSHKTSSQGFTA